jgi:hypothetical protein
LLKRVETTPIEITVGCLYYTRSGRTAKITYKDNSAVLPYMGMIGHDVVCWTPKGEAYDGFQFVPSYDLIAAHTGGRKSA